MQSLSSHSVSKRANMQPDHLNEEGLAESEEIEIPLNIIFFFSILLIISYGTHFNGHFHLFGLIARILFWTCEYWIILQDALFYWYFLLHFNCYITTQRTAIGLYQEQRLTSRSTNTLRSTSTSYRSS